MTQMESTPRNAMILAIVNGAIDSEEFKDKTIIQNKIEVSEYFIEQGLDDTDFTLERVNEDKATVEHYMNQIDDMVEEENGGGDTPVSPGPVAPPLKLTYHAADISEGTARMDVKSNKNGKVALLKDITDHNSEVASVKVSANKLATLNITAQAAVTTTKLAALDNTGHISEDGPNVIIGTTGDDTLTGTTGDDYLYGTVEMMYM